MKWKAVTRRTRILGFLALLCAAICVWSTKNAKTNPCATLTRYDAAPGMLRPAVADGLPPRLLRVQDDSDSGDNTVATPELRSEENEKPRLAPCASTIDTHVRLRGASFVAFLLFTVATCYSYYRDQRRYRKRVIGRTRRDEHRRRRDAGIYPKVNTPVKMRTGYADLCACGCGEGVAEGQLFVPAHAQMLRLELEAKAGGLLALRDLVEQHAHPDEEHTL